MCGFYRVSTHRVYVARQLAASNRDCKVWGDMIHAVRQRKVLCDSKYPCYFCSLPIPFTNTVHDGCASGEADHTLGIPACLRIRELAHVAAAAASAVMVCSPLLLAARPKTPLRVFCIAAFEFLARLGGGTLGKRGRLAMAIACDFGSLRDDYYDHRRFDASEYRSLRSELRRMAPEAATSRYIRELRQAERGRPILSASDQGVADIAKAVIAYRTSVLDLSLRWMQEISGLSVDAVKFHALLSLVGLMQITDDVLDWKDDQAGGCPSYVTALLLDRPRTGVALPLRAQADALLRRVVGAARQDAGAVPFAVAGMLTWTLVVALLKVRFPKWVRFCGSSTFSVVRKEK